jgi:L-iditol 2-dehydrogenase
VLTEPGRIEVRETDTPVPGPGESLIRVRAVGVCGTDLSIYRGKIPVDLPRVLGHEVVGDVVEPGESGPRAGARVVVDPSVACGRCARCREGRANICPNGALLGRDQDGGLREVVAVPSANLYEVPAGLDDELGPLIQVLTTCVHGQRRTDVFPGNSVVVIGLGVTGLLHVQLARLRGASPVVGVTRDPARLALARDLGADTTVPGDDPAAVERVLEATGGGADVAIECAGTVATLGHAIAMVRVGGRVLAYGTIAQSEGALPFYDVYYKELDIAGARAAQAEDFPVAIDAVASGRVRLERLVGARIELERVGGALAGETPSGLKTIVRMPALG